MSSTSHDPETGPPRLSTDTLNNQINPPHTQKTPSPTNSTLLHQTWGDIPSTTTTNFRIIHLNCNGIGDTDGKIIYNLHQLYQLNPSLTSLNEININMNNPQMKNTLLRNLCNIDQRSYTTHTYQPIDNTTATYLPGGCLLNCTGKWSHNIDKTTSGNDLYGRYCWQIMKRDPLPPLLIISCYQICKTTPDLDTTTNYAQLQTSYMLRNGMEHPNLRQLLWDDLTTLIEKHNYEAIITIDANTPITDTAFQTFLNHNNLIDVHQITHPDLPDTPTHNRGSKKIDYILATASLVPAINSCGILPIDNDLSDHRLLWCDFDRQTLLYDNLPSVYTNRQLLDPTKPARIRNYIEKLDEYFKYHKIYQKIFDLNDKFKITEPNNYQPLIDEYIKLDKLKTQLMLKAEKKCGHLITSLKYHWSPDFKKACKTVYYWRSRLYHHRHKIELTDYHLELKTTYNITDDIEDKEENIIQKLTSAWKELYNARKTSYDLRNDHLKELAMYYYEEGKKLSYEQALKHLKTVDKIKRAHNKLTTEKITSERKQSKKTQSVTHILLPIPHTDDTDRWIRIDNKEDMENMILQTNTQVYLTSQHSPFVQSPISEYIGFSGELNGTKDILSGELNIEIDDHLLTQFISNLATPQKIKSIDKHFDYDDFQKIFKNIRTDKASSPSGLHLAHYKVACTHEPLAMAHTIMIALPFQYGFTHDRWCHINDVMIQKDPSPKINRFRIVQLIEADYQAAMRYYYAHRLMKNTVKCQQNPTTVYAQLPKRRPQDAVKNLILNFDYSRIQCQPLMVNYNDMSYCYDALAYPLINITCQRLGLQPPVIQATIKTLQQAQHHIITAHGVSKGYAKIWDVSNRRGGGGQGHASAGPEFHTFLLPLINTYAQRCPGTHIYNPNTNSYMTQHVNSYIDDNTNLYHPPKYTYSYKYPYQHVYPTFEENCKIWKNLVEYTGGVLNGDKCKLVTLFYNFDTHGFPYLVTKNNIDSQIYISKYTPMQHIDVTEAYKYLGIQIKADGTWKTEYYRRLDQSKLLAAALQNPKLTPIETELAYHSRYRSIFTYPLSVTWFTDDQCDTIQSPCIRALKNKLHLNRNFPNAVTYGPTRYGGLGLLDLKNEQGIAHINDLFHHIGQTTHMTDMMLSTLNATQFQIGTSTPILSKPNLLPPYATASEFTKLAKFLNNHNLSIHIPNGLYLPKPQRTNDKCIMDLLPTMDFNPYQQKQINQCRLYLRVIYLSDISDGQYIYEWAGSKSHTTYFKQPSIYEWPSQPKPPLLAWNTWKNYILQAFQIHIMPNARTWLLPHQNHLGEWIQTSHINKPHLPVIHLLPTVPPSLYDRRLIGTGKLRTGLSTEIFMLLEQNKLLGATDGSVIPNKTGTYTYLLGNKDTKDVIYKSNGPADGHPDYIESTRAELYGLNAIINFLLYITQMNQNLLHHDPTKIHLLTIWTDSEAALTNLQAPTTHPKAPNSDIIYSILHNRNVLLTKNKIDITLRHVKGHQKYQNEADRPIESYFNKICDEDSKQHHQYHGEYAPKPYPQLFPTNPITLLHGDRPIHINPTKYMRDILNRHILLNYITDPDLSHHIQTQHINLIDWPAFEHSLKRSLQKRSILLKLIYNWHYTGHQVTKFYPNSVQPTSTAQNLMNTNEFLHCNHYETPTHYLSCPHNPDRAKAIKEFQDTLHSVHTCPFVTKLFIQAIQPEQIQYPQLIHMLPIHLQILFFDAYNDQTDIGWKQVYRGRIAKSWSVFHQKYCEHSKVEKPPPNVWSYVVVKATHDYILNIWTARNNLKHGYIEHTYEERRRDSILHQVKTRLDKGPEQIAEQYHKYFQYTYEQMTTKSTAKLERWLQTIDSCKVASLSAHGEGDDFSLTE